MTYKTLGLFALTGSIAWAGATLFYAGFGGVLIERAFLICVLAAVLTGIVLIALFGAMARARKVRREALVAAALAFAAPSVLLSIAFAPGTLRLFASTAPSTDNFYGLYLSVAYLSVISIAASPRPALQRQRA